MGKPSPHRTPLTSEVLTRTFEPPPGVETIWDADLRGFGLRTRGSADRATWKWIYGYRHKATGKQVKHTLGPFIALTPHEARENAKAKAKHSNELGDQWAIGKAQQAAAKAERERPTVAELWTTYRERGGDRLASAKTYERLWELHVKPHFGAMKVAEVEPEDVERFKVSMKATPGACNRALSVLSAMMTKAIVWKHRRGCAPENPVRGVERYAERRINFHFKTEQLASILEAADAYKDGGAARTTQGRRMVRSGGFGVAVWLLAFTGARASEVLKARWDQFEEREGGGLIWTVGRTKSGLPVERFLAEIVAQRLRDWRTTSRLILANREGDDAKAPLWVFPQLKRPALPINRMEKAWLEIKTAAGVTEGRVHDLRHTAATHLRRNGATLGSIQQQLGHTSVRTTERYAHVVSERAIETGQALADIIASARGNRT